MEFPAIQVVPDENVAAMGERIQKDFASKDIQLSDFTDKFEATGFARIFAAVTPDEFHVFFLCPFEWNEPREVRIFPKLLLKQAAESRRVVFHLHAAYPPSPLMAYTFADARRFYYGLQLMMTLNGKMNVTAQEIPNIAVAAAVALARNYPELFPGKPTEAWLAPLDQFVLQHLRNEKDPQKADTSEYPLSSLLGVGCLAGEISRLHFQKDHGWNARWIGDGEDTQLEIGVMEKKGLFRSAEYRSILTSNPIQKAIKLYQYGSGDSMESMYESTIALVDHELSKK